MTNLENKLKFIEIVDEMKSITRTISLQCGRKESDADHSYHLAIMVMTFIDDFPELDLLRCLQIALLHDLVEIFAGDTYIFDTDGVKTKEKRERESLDKLEAILWKSSFRDFRNIIEEYEHKNTKEAIFVHQLDKLHPIIQIYLTKWTDFVEYKAPKQDIIKNKYSKIDDMFHFRQVLDTYFWRMERENMFYNP